MSRKRDEPVRLTRIYTRGGDEGETSLGDGSRVPKTHPRVEASGEVDELNSLIGWAAALEGSPGLLQGIQNELFDLGADLATPERRGRERLRLSKEQIELYLNRLSDLLFILARAANAGVEETLWKPGASAT